MVAKRESPTGGEDANGQPITIFFHRDVGCTCHGMHRLRHWVLQGVKDNQASIEGKTGGNCDSNQNGGVASTTSSVSVDSMRVNEALLAVGSQHMHQT